MTGPEASEARRARRRVRTRGRVSDARFRLLAEGVEVILVQAAVAIGLVLILSQLLLTTPAARWVMSYVARLEGVAVWTEPPTVTIALVSGAPPSGAFVLLNGRRMGSLAGGPVCVAVVASDLLEVDGTGLEGDGLFEVAGTTGRVDVPRIGLRVVTHQGVASVGRVSLGGR